MFIDLSNLSAHSGSSITNRVGIARQDKGDRFHSSPTNTCISAATRIVMTRLTMTTTSAQSTSTVRNRDSLEANFIHLRSSL